jgi:hypothetical protein
LSRRGRSLPASASGLDPHRDSISSRFDCSYNTMPIDLPKSWTEADGAWDPQGVSRPFPSWNWYISTEIYLCHACSCQEILRTETAGQGKRIHGASNIVFSNGLYDPWHGGGVLHNLSKTVLAVILQHGAHHLDLMFSNPADPPDAVAARRVEVQEMRRWVAEANTRNRRAAL